ncbi:MAG: CHAT domain-containing protein, partial [Chloroflexi bacterium]|nr:CHAT domain-containing protein [Chloroflexota bacterium]
HRTLIGKVDALLHMGRYHDSLRTAEKCRRVFAAHNEPVLEAKMIMNQGNIYHRLDRYPESLKLYRMARKTFETHKEPLLTALANTNLGNSYSNTSQFPQAEQAFRRAGTTYRKLGLRTALAMNDSNLGFLLFLKGDFGGALSKMNSARRIFEEIGVARNIATVEFDSAEVYAALDWKDKSLASYDKALKTFESLGFASEVAKGRMGKAMVLVQTKQGAQAEHELDSAEKHFEFEENQVYLGLVELHRAILRQQQKRHQEAIALAGKAEQRFIDGNLPAKTAYAQMIAGHSHRELGELTQAETEFKNALTAGQTMNLPWLLFESHYALGQTYHAGRKRDARRHYAEAIEALERTRVSLRPEEMKAAFVRNKQGVYGDMVSLCLDDDTEEGLEDAFAFIERSKSQSLLDMLAGQIDIRSRERGADPKIAKRLQTLREELNTYYNMVDRYELREGQRAMTIISGMRNHILEREEEFSELLEELQLKDGQAASLMAPIAANVKQARRFTEPGTTLVEYFAIGDQLGAFVLNRDEPIRAFRNLASVSNVAALGRKLRFQISKPSLTGFQKAGLNDHMIESCRTYLELLFEELLEPLAHHLQPRLLIVPHGPLHYIPFHALHDGEHYLLDRHEVSCAPSASVLKFCWDKPSSDVRRPLVIGVEDAAIPNAVREAKQVASLFADATLLADKAATQQQLEELAPFHDALHLASHGVYRSDNPAFSSIKMGDGWLTLHDIYNLDLRKTSLVTLSACQTGVNAVAAGDELIGLSRGFFFAGTPSLVVSLWDVNDEITGNLMNLFYKGLREGKTKSGALRDAQRQVREEKAHPYYWAPFVLLGKPS